MDTNDKMPRKRGFKSWYIWVGILAVLLVSCFSSIGEPGRRADAVYKAISPGMTAGEVLSLLTGRYLCTYIAQVNGEETIVSQEEFLKIMDGASRINNRSGKVSIAFLGSSPLRVSITVKFGPDGKVESLTDPRGQD